MKLQCKVCGWIICDDVSRIDKKHKYIQCPNPKCMRHLENPFYEEEKNENK